MNPSDIAQLVQDHKWIPLSAIVIGLLVRLMKSDTTFPITIPPRARMWAAFVLGFVGAVLQYYVQGEVSWTNAIVGGVISSVFAVVGHNAVIDSMRGGREFVVPGLMIPGASPSPGKPASTPPKAAETKTTEVKTPVPLGSESAVAVTPEVKSDDDTTPIIIEAPAEKSEKKG